MNKKKATELVSKLMDAAYDSGYYSGKKEYGSPRQIEARDKRNKLRDEIIRHLSTCPECSFWHDQGEDCEDCGALYQGDSQ